MAIKGKGRSKRRGVAAAPKPVYVQPKHPWYLKRRFWITAGIVAAVAAVVGITIAVIVGTHDRHQREARAALRRTERSIVQRFGDQVDSALSPVGKGATLTSFQPFPDFSSYIGEFQKGNLTTKVVVKQADTYSTQAATALAAVQKIDGASMIGAHAVDLNDLVNGQTEIVHGLQIYQQVADGLKLAAQASGSQRKDLITHTTSLLTIASSVFNEGYQAIVGLRARFGLVSLNPSVSGSPPPGIPTSLPSP